MDFLLHIHGKNSSLQIVKISDTSTIENIRRQVGRLTTSRPLQRLEQLNNAMRALRIQHQHEELLKQNSHREKDRIDVLALRRLLS